MPFRDREWEDFQRDCGFFPAYTDYIFGVDERPEVVDEPGLHSQIYGPSPRPPQRLLGLPSYVPPVGAPLALLRPNDLVTNPQYSSVPPQERAATNLHITQAWAIMNSNAGAAQKAKAMEYVKDMSRVAAIKRQEYRAREAAKWEAPKRVEQEQEEHDASLLATTETRGLMEVAQQSYGPTPDKQLLHSRVHQAEAEAVTEQEMVQHKYAIRDISQLPAYVQSRLPQLWACTEVVVLHGPPTDPDRLSYYQQAQQYVMGFLQSVPPDGRRYIRFVMDGMVKLREQGCDPLVFLQKMPHVEDVIAME